MKSQDCWEILRISPTRNSDLIRSAFRKQAKRHHPDSSNYQNSQNGPSEFDFIDIKAAEREALQKAQSDNLVLVTEKMSELWANKSFSEPKLNFYCNVFFQLSVGQFFKIFIIFPAILICSLLLERLQQVSELSQSFHLIFSVILGIIDGIFLVVLGGIIFFWLPGLVFILIFWIGVRSHTGLVTFAICWLISLATYLVGFTPWSSWQTSEELRRNVGNFSTWIVLPSFLLACLLGLWLKQIRFEKSQTPTP
jgi:hypothetical protein